MNKQMDRDIRYKKLLIIWAILAIIMAAAITVTSVSIVTSQVKSDRDKAATGAAMLATKRINADKINGWLANGADEEYAVTYEILTDILESASELDYLYVYQIRDDGCHVVFDTDPNPDERGKLGDFQEFDGSFNDEQMAKLLRGEKIASIEGSGEYGWLLTHYEPIYDSNGKCVAYAGADVSMTEVYRSIMTYVLIIIIIATVFLVACIFIGLKMSINNHKANELEILKERQLRDKKLIREIIESFAKVIDMKDSYTQGHSSRVAKYTAMLAKELGYDEDTIEQYYNIALMHDIGKIGIPDQVLNKPGKLTEDEYNIIKSHTMRGYEALKSISLMPEIVVGAEAHHERPDGKGYPYGLKNGEIPRVAQIIAVADTFDAMYSDRPYRKRMNYDKAVSIIRDASGTQLTSDVVDAFLRLADRGEFRAPDDTGGGSFEDIANIHKNQE